MQPVIIMVSHSSKWGGAEKIFYHTANTFRSEFKTILWLPSKSGTLSKHLLNENIDNIFFKPNFMPGKNLFKHFFRFIFWNIPSIFYIYNICKSKGVTAVYNNTALNFSGLYLSSILKKPLIWHIHEMPYAGKNKIHHLNPIFKSILRHYVKNSQTIFVSKACRDQWLTYLNLKLEQIQTQIIYNPILIKKINKKNKNDTITIGFIGSNEPNKNVDLLINTFINLTSTHKYLELRLAGPGMDQIKEKINNYPISNKMNISGEVEFEDFIANIDILVMPSFVESWGLAAIEAIYSDVTTIISNTSPIFEVIRDDINAISFDPSSEIDLYNKLSHLLDEFHKISEIISFNNKKLLPPDKININFDICIKNTIHKANSSMH